MCFLLVLDVLCSFRSQLITLSWNGCRLPVLTNSGFGLLTKTAVSEAAEQPNTSG